MAPARREPCCPAPCESREAASCRERRHNPDTTMVPSSLARAPMVLHPLDRLAEPAGHPPNDHERPRRQASASRSRALGAARARRKPPAAVHRPAHLRRHRAKPQQDDRRCPEPGPDPRRPVVSPGRAARRLARDAPATNVGSRVPRAVGRAARAARDPRASELLGLVVRALSGRGAHPGARLAPASAAGRRAVGGPRHAGRHERRAQLHAPLCDRLPQHP